MPPTKIASCTQVNISCTDLDVALEFYTGQLGFRLDMIMPADTPRIAAISGHGISVRLEVAKHVPYTQPPSLPSDTSPLLVSRAGSTDAWIQGRAGMEYRDLIPGRLDGRVIASHIRIRDGGSVPDYVHYHQVGFQMIFCRHGWVRVVYQDQGPPFVMHAGDCVLQPPTIRHRVLESSPGLEVIEIGCPAEHPTFRDHVLELPTRQLRPEREFGGQHFVRHVAADAWWQRSQNGLEYCDLGIGDATHGLAKACVVRHSGNETPATTNRHPASPADDGSVVILSVLEGQLQLHGPAFGTQLLVADDTCVIPSYALYRLDPSSSGQWLEVTLSADV